MGFSAKPLIVTNATPSLLAHAARSGTCLGHILAFNVSYANSTTTTTTAATTTTTTTTTTTIANLERKKQTQSQGQSLGQGKTCQSILQMKGGDQWLIAESARIIFVQSIAKDGDILYAPEHQSQCNIVDFTITASALEEQLLDTVVEHERKDLAEQHRTLRLELANDRAKLDSLAAELLHVLSNFDGNILEDANVIQLLNEMNDGAHRTAQKIAGSKSTQSALTETSELYRPVAVHGTCIYFTIQKMLNQNPLYQFSLSKYHSKFLLALQTSRGSTDARVRIDAVIDRLYRVGRALCARTLFAGDRKAFDLLLALRRQLTEGYAEQEHVNALLGTSSQNSGDGNNGSARHRQSGNRAAEWLPSGAWEALSKHSESIPELSTIAGQLCVERKAAAWREWFDLPRPEAEPTPFGAVAMLPRSSN